MGYNEEHGESVRTPGVLGTFGGKARGFNTKLLIAHEDTP